MADDRPVAALVALLQTEDVLQRLVTGHRRLTAQEALANVAKHAQATRAGVTLSYLARSVAVDVRDDGKGFDPARLSDEPAGDGGFGLVAMRQRIEGLSGTLQVESEPGAGTGISACVPAEARG